MMRCNGRCVECVLCRVTSETNKSGCRRMSSLIASSDNFVGRLWVYVSVTCGSSGCTCHTLDDALHVVAPSLVVVVVQHECHIKSRIMCVFAVYILSFESKDREFSEREKSSVHPQNFDNPKCVPEGSHILSTPFSLILSLS